ncbi:MAG: hypothetical protein LUG62_00200 [Clostridiales bacterium]|nr:hypothetical protein [Clostridiales bacterium]
MRENDIGINSRAVDIARLPVEIYAGTASGEEYISPNIHFFHSSDCCAREYWRCHPLTAGERRIVLIGFGNYGRALLQRAIMTNVISPDQQIAYHIFGDAGDFLNVHYGLRQVFSIQEESRERDSLIFHEDSWASAHVILEDADRIIISEDEEQENWRILWQLRQYYHIRGRMDMRSVRSVAGLPCFGSNDTIYTPEHILRTTLNQVAISMNDLYRSTHTGDTLDWSQLDDCLKQSKIAASEHIIVKVRILLQDEELSYLTQDLLTRAYMVYERNIQNPEVLERYRRIEHLRWLRFYAFYNWGFGDVHDQALRQDPCFCPYEELAPKLRHHYDYAWTVIDRLKLVS